jgi:RimJ/RimL family protein N-acetyltransferase/predicted SprT family Zn-dependent metalloprotease
MSAISFESKAPRLEGDLVTLVQLDSSFFEEFFAAVNEPETLRLTATKKTFTESEIRDWLATRPGASERIDWAILHHGEYVGEVVLNELNEAKATMNLRIALAGPHVYGRGFGSEAIALAVDYGLEVLGLSKITLEVLVDNPRAIGAYEKVGFVAGREFSEGKHRYLRMSINKFDRVLALAELKMAEHLDVQLWSFKWDNAKRRAGLCNYRDKTISISTYHAEVHSIDETMQVVLHEIAHALCGKVAGHGKKWLATAKSIGYRAEKFTGKEIAEQFAPWVGLCPAGHEHYRYRKPTSALACGLCSRSFSKANVIEWRPR